jgi:hypothetical protein
LLQKQWRFEYFEAGKYQTLEEYFSQLCTCFAWGATDSDKVSFYLLVRETNKLVKSMCDQNNWYFIANSNIRTTHLNARGLHLNHSGSLLLQNNFKLAIAN